MVSLFPLYWSLVVASHDNAAVFAVVKTSLSEIKDGSYIGVTGMPEPDGTQKAIAVHIFPENQRGAAEGFRPWDARANSTMTNATVALRMLRAGGPKQWCTYPGGCGGLPGVPNFAILLAQAQAIAG